MIRSVLVCAVVMTASVGANEMERDYPIQPVAFTQVQFSDAFWKPRMLTNTRSTLPACIEKCEDTGRFDNFAKAAGRMEGAFEGIYFNDSDVFKVIEGAAYTLRLRDDPRLEGYMDSLIDDIAAAQEEDGYLYTIRTIDPNNVQRGSGEERWSYLIHSHELYNVGHMYEAAVAYYQATGKRQLLDVSIKNVDLLEEIFGLDALRDVPGHQEIEIGLVKLYRLTGDRRYLDLAEFFLDERGHAHGRELYGEYHQDHLPVVDQSEAVGHAVRAGYLYSGMADVAAIKGREDYIAALNRIWGDMISRKMYVTGGIGAERRGEAFGAAYHLPNAEAYAETCAAIANALWNHRMFLLSGDAKYIDVLERVIYNGFLVGVSLSGDEYFYPNPLASDGHFAFNQGATHRTPWFDCACCPVNIVRFVPSLPGYIYAQRDHDVYVNLYAAGSGSIILHDQAIRLEQETHYPWDGAIRVTVRADEPLEFALNLRIPGWARETPVPSDLYTFLDSSQAAATVSLNGTPLTLDLDRGFLRVEREWRDGDVIDLDFPMPVRRVGSHSAVEANRGRVALQRGPLVYCFEGVDHDGRALDLTLPDNAVFGVEHQPDLLGGVTFIHSEGLRTREDGAAEPVSLTAVPYYVWNHRGPGEMVVWIPRRVSPPLDNQSSGEE